MSASTYGSANRKSGGVDSVCAMLSRRLEQDVDHLSPIMICPEVACSAHFCINLDI